MTRALAFDPHGWEDYVSWQTQDRKTLKGIILLIADVLREPFASQSAIKLCGLLRAGT